MSRRTRRRSRHETVVVAVDDVMIGGTHPVVVQSMTNTPTADVRATAEQVRELSAAGSELVRVTVNTAEAAKAVPHIIEELHRRGCHVPLVGDFHYNGHTLLKEHPACAEGLAKYRINPGNVGRGERHDDNFASIIELAARYGKAVRIGVNWGSLDQELLAELMDENARRDQPRPAQKVMKTALVESALRSARFAEEVGLTHDRIVLSTKVSVVPDLIDVYRDLAGRCDYPLHLGLTEAGMGTKGIVASTAALAVLLHQGIGDTIRVSLTPRPGGDRTEEVVVAQQILQSLGIRSFAPQVTSCPGCGRTSSTYFQELASQVQEQLRERMTEWRDLYPGVEDLNVAVMGCVVNGPGESKHADIGISLPGLLEEPRAPVYMDGQQVTTLQGDELAGQFMKLIEEYVERRFGASH